MQENCVNGCFHTARSYVLGLSHAARLSFVVTLTLWHCVSARAKRFIAEAKPEALSNGCVPHTTRIGVEKFDEKSEERFAVRRGVVERTISWLSKYRAPPVS